MDNETREMFNLILSEIGAMRSKMDTLESKMDAMERKMDVMERKMDVMERKMDVMESKMDTMQKDITEMKADAKANYQELLVLDKRTAEIQHRLSGIESVTAQNCYDITLLKKQA